MAGGLRPRRLLKIHALRAAAAVDFNAAHTDKHTHTLLPATNASSHNAPPEIRGTHQIAHTLSRDKHSR
jgi:hypothetical protein